ncbi:hypothetical protein UlMin_019841 [Ulmus minor]
MQFLLQNPIGTMAICSLSRKASFSSSAVKWEGGISMVQGASRGIALEFVKQLLEKTEEGHVVAMCRNPNAPTGLLDLKNKFAERLSILPLDVTNESNIEVFLSFSITYFFYYSKLKVKERSLNLLINASGILSIPDILQPGTNFTSLLKPSFKLRKDSNFFFFHAMDDKNHIVEFARKKYPIACILLHPGTVDTDLLRPFQRNVPKGKLFTKEFSVQKLLSIINNVKCHHNGKFSAWDGQEIPW